MKIIKTTALAAATAGMLATAVPATAATAWNSERTTIGAGETSAQNSRYRDDRRYYSQRGYRDYDRRGYRGDPVYRDTRVWRGRDGRVYCRKKDGTTGLIIGGAVGALLGREIDGGYDRSLGTILGAAGGALLGREVARGNSRCR
ncbi:hypothetical protein GCM10011371_10620 [Novosphingobium marinum]|uniref:17 kDa surface antigen n=1 Tax=Novosphingobium marinum TaxID=1514948 RepID=A0A7Y9XV38_9SPHN|nr:glycine zipper 2TM domain-containing protein [Novosphingobium marinum]NYH95171.1 uncharacterized protein YcfJ [Novosphingobium marinum]GGC24892.1 hypothetical protein GCM10011371_10620 [Novosphingobium marinum]